MPKETEMTNRPMTLTITKRVSVKDLKLSVLGMRRRAALVAADLLYNLITEFEESEKAGVEYEDLILTVGFTPGRKNQ